MSYPIEFTVPGRWCSERKRNVADGTRRVDLPERRDFKRKVALFATMAMRGREPFSGPLWIKYRFRKPKSSSYRKRDEWPYKRPDYTNLAKIVDDALEGGQVFSDDAQICRALIEKVFDQEWGLDISVGTLSDGCPAKQQEVPDEENA